MLICFVIAADERSTLTVELTRHERGLLMLKLAPEQTGPSPSKGHLVITDLHGTGKAIGDKLQVHLKVKTTLLRRDHVLAI
jgi:hypothetical protein